VVCNGRGFNSGFLEDCVKSEDSSDSRYFHVPQTPTSPRSPVLYSQNFCLLFPGLTGFRSGIHEVGILFGILRKLQHWSLSSILFEYRSFAGPNARFDEEQFIELFDETALVIPRALPTWWVEQQEL